MDNLLAQLRSSDEAESLAGAQALATRLSHAAGPEEKLLVAALKATTIVRTAVDVAAQRREDAPLQHAVLGSLVNLACIGGHQIVKAQGGFAHMLESLRSPKKSVQYFAVAGVQNMVGDRECLQAVVDTDSDVILEEMLSSPSEEIRRFATGALANISEVQKRVDAGGLTPSTQTERLGAHPAALVEAADRRARGAAARWRVHPAAAAARRVGARQGAEGV